MQQQHQLTISVREAQQALGVSRRTAYQLVTEGTLESIRVGRRRLVKLESLRSFVERGGRA